MLFFSFSFFKYKEVVSQLLARLFHSPTMSHLRSHGPIVRCIELETSKFMSIPKPMSPPSLRLRDHIDRPVTPNSLPSLIGRAPTSNTIFNARDGVSPLQVKHRNCNLCCLLIWFFFFSLCPVDLGMFCTNLYH